MMNKALLALYALQATNTVFDEEHKDCCESPGKDGVSRRNEETRNPDRRLLDAVATIISLRSGRQPVAVTAVLQDTHLDLVIASEQPITTIERSDIERYFTLLSEASDSPSDESQGKLLKHAYHMCGAEVYEILTAGLQRLERTLPRFAEAATKEADERAKTGHENGHVGLPELARRAIESLMEYRTATAADAEEALAIVPELHRSLKGVIPALYHKKPALELDSIANNPVHGDFAEVCSLSRAVDDTIRGAAANSDLRELLGRGAVRCDWVEHPAKRGAASIIIDEPFLEGLRPCLPALNDASSIELVQLLEAKLSVGERYPTNRAIAHDAGNLPSTFEVQVSTHCEVALISHLADKAFESTLYIATALPACYACHLLVNAMRNVQGCNSFRLGRYSGIIECGWEFPSALPYADEVEKIMLTQSNALLKAAIELRRRDSDPEPFDVDGWN